ncbi:dimethyl sulfoxide reductase anchor subunit [Nisaea acidiphila]|uniref:Dimethyl sulfoxide reductase anchor subunit n=1 Tax=Nisaea acidiphila TaxID=1862145 RepID=A0A9J7AQA9_9PROT|nr:DmsC/YnfH family molybdoenzyme membrane anchor subunit [Nisaea acidiphila]UUX49407.1 dimethyl sulfoxide reductase anchor subunit [Nisaea acidiphila]
MHPALSVIFFTTASGAGYGLLVWLALHAALIGDADPVIGWVGLPLSLGLVTAGLLSSTFHLGHPERAWRALSQWRSSWLSREGVLAVLTYIPALAFAGGWLLLGENDGLWSIAGLIAAALALVTVYCTAMIYRSLKTIPNWHSRYTVPGYIAMALATGGLWFLPLLAFSGSELRDLAFPVTALLLATAAIKWRYWSSCDGAAPTATSGTATGLGAQGRVRLLEGPTTSETYVMREMGYRIGRKHAAKLRRLAALFGFLMPVVILAALLAMPGSGHIAGGLALLAAISGSIGVVTERWLFFAEAKHVSTLYYGEEFA